MHSAQQEAPTTSAHATARNPRVGDFWGGIASMLVALPAAIAFGVSIYSPLGASFAARGALAGIIGAIALGIVAALFGGTRRLITAPSAPATAVLAAFAIEMFAHGARPEKIVAQLALAIVLCAACQVAFGLLGLGRLIKYMPYPVVSGYLTGVALIIIFGQFPKFLGAPKDAHFVDAIADPSNWRWEALVVGGVTIIAAVVARAVTKRIPSSIIGLAFGVATYFALSYVHPELRALASNRLVVGPLSARGDGLIAATIDYWRSFRGIGFEDLRMVIFPALTLATLLSIDTLKTCLVLDAQTRTRHNPNRELIGQGLGNFATAALGGVAGSGTMGPTLINLSSGGQSRMSGVFEGLFALIALLALGKFIAWIPIAALAGILIVVGFRMFDLNSLRLLRSRATILDFAVIVTVVIVAVTVSLIAASGIGIVLAILLFLRGEIGGTVIRRITYGNERFSKEMRLPHERSVLEQNGAQTVIIELQGSLFFGTADQLYNAVEPELAKRRYFILDLRRVTSIDYSAAHTLELIEDAVAEHGGYVLFSHLPAASPSGQDMRAYLKTMGLARASGNARIFSELNFALQWVEDKILGDEHVERATQHPLTVGEIDLFRGRKPETLAALEAVLEQRTVKAGQLVFRHGDRGHELFLIRSGEVRILMPLENSRQHHLATFSRGDFFGEISFLDNQPRSADALALTDTELYVLSRERFEAVGEQHHRLQLNLMEGIAASLCARLRMANSELRSMQDL